MRTLTILLGLLFACGGATAQVTALTGATVHPVSGPAIENATVLIDGERIVALGADLSIPDGTRVVDLRGRHVYPGFVHPGSALGLTEIGSVAGTVDTSEMGEINAALRVEVAFNHDSALLPVNVAGGILTTHTVPGGGLIRGSSAVMAMEGWSWEDMVVKAPAGMHIAFPAGAASDGDNQDLQLIERTLDQARAWRKARQAFEAGNAPRPPMNDQLAALAPLVAGEQTLFLHAGKEKEILAALDWAEKQEFGSIVLVAGPDVQYVAERLAADGIGVILDGVYEMPTRRWEPYDMAYVAAAKLHEAGVRFAISDGGGGFGATNARNLPFHAGSAAAFGLPKDAALKAVTLWPAELLGVAEELGSLEPGKRATLMVTDGDPLEVMTAIERVWINGAEYDLGRSKHRQLFERYRERIQQQVAGQGDL
ncbi:MAG: amidohydrolase family protein [Wenzhouxiangellaceae bacterium]|nr:amidohydrolase family protein [Wenzhouxiangellaceae bacterium]